MTRAPGVQGSPRVHLEDPSAWPHGKTGYAPARYAQGLAVRLTEAVGQTSYRSVSRKTGISHGTISALIKGKTWPDLVTVALLEWGLATILWPGSDVLLSDLRTLRAEAHGYRGWRTIRDARARLGVSNPAE